MLMTEPKIIVAIDSSNQEQALNIIDQLDSELCMIKIGSVNFNSLGNLCINKAFEKGFKIFLDLKLHDIPNTVASAIQSLAALEIDYLFQPIKIVVRNVIRFTLRNFTPAFENYIIGITLAFRN